MNWQEADRIPRIRDLPVEERPREKMVRQGPQALTNEELMAVILGSGTRKEGVLALARRIIQQYAPQAAYTEPDVQKIMDLFGLSRVKACQVVAALELGRRLFGAPSHTVYLRNPEEVYAYVKPMETLAQEHLRGLYLDTRNRLIRDETLTIGTLDTSLAHPREILAPALESRCAGFILVHNHPSGDPTPSQEDHELTRRILEAAALLGLTFLDHLIVGRNAYVSLRKTTHLWDTATD